VVAAVDATSFSSEFIVASDGGTLNEGIVLVAALDEEGMGLIRRKLPVCCIMTENYRALKLVLCGRCFLLFFRQYSQSVKIG
jgi:hypothetical protein